MEKNNCNEVGHKYGVWDIKGENEIFRVCVSCGFVEQLPVTAEILEEVKKQIDAGKLLSSFTMLDVSDVNLIGYLNVILNDVVNYVNKDQKASLLAKLKEIENGASLTVENKNFIGRLITAINENNLELFYDTYDLFYEYNYEVLSIEPINESQGYVK